MDSRLRDLSKYRLAHAKEDLETARVDYEHGLFAASMNRSYYAVFHAIRAVNSLEAFDSKKHSGVISFFTQTFLKTERMKNGRRISEIIKNAQHFREKSDYEDFYIADKEEAEEQLQNAELLLGLVEEYLAEQYEAG